MLRVKHGVQKVRTDVLPCGVDLALRDPRAAAAKIDAIQLFHPRCERYIAALPYIGDDIRSDQLGFTVALAPRAEEILFYGGSEFKDAHQSTILFNGYSTIPWALAAFNFGKICRTT